MRRFLLAGASTAASASLAPSVTPVLSAFVGLGQTGEPAPASSGDPAPAPEPEPAPLSEVVVPVVGWAAGMVGATLVARSSPSTIAKKARSRSKLAARSSRRVGRLRRLRDDAPALPAGFAAPELPRRAAAAVSAAAAPFARRRSFATRMARRMAGDEVLSGCPRVPARLRAGVPPDGADAVGTARVRSRARRAGFKCARGDDGASSRGVSQADCELHVESASARPAAAERGVGVVAMGDGRSRVRHEPRFDDAVAELTWSLVGPLFTRNSGAW